MKKLTEISMRIKAQLNNEIVAVVEERQKMINNAAKVSV